MLSRMRSSPQPRGVSRIISHATAVQLPGPMLSDPLAEGGGEWRERKSQFGEANRLSSLRKTVVPGWGPNGLVPVLHLSVEVCKLIGGGRAGIRFP